MLSLHLALSNIRRKMGPQISLGILILLTAVLLNAGFVLLTSIGGFFDAGNERLHGPHYVIRMQNNDYKKEYPEFFQSDPRVSEISEDEFVAMGFANYRVNGGPAMMLLPNIMNADAAHAMNRFYPLETAEAAQNNALYVPCYFKGNGYHTGDTVTFTYQKKDFNFQIAGFFETAWLGSSAASCTNFYLSGPAYQRLYKELGGGRFINVRVHDEAELPALVEDFKEETGIHLEALGRNVNSFELTIGDARTVGVTMPVIMSAIVVAFSCIILFIALLVIRFRIANHIEDHMQDIGALKAMGYTGRQIEASLMLEYGLVGLAGIVAGTWLSYGFLQMLGGFIAASVGLLWVGTVYAGANLACTVLLMLPILLTAYLRARRVRKLDPVAALRGGLASHSFRRNWFPLEKGGGLSLRLSLKQVAANLGQYGMMAVILAGVTFAAAFCTITYDNFVGSDSILGKNIGDEISDATVKLAQHADFDAMRQKLAAEDGVRSTSVLQSQSVDIGGKVISCMVSDNFSELETVAPSEGSFPQEENEIMITGAMADSMGMGIGDTLEASVSGVCGKYIITGYFPVIGNFGLTCMMSGEGYKRLDPSFSFSALNIYLEEGLLPRDHIARLEKEYNVASRKMEEDNNTVQGRARRKAEEKMANLLSMYGVDSAQYALMRDGEVILSGSTQMYPIDSVENTREIIETSITNISVMISAMVMMVLAAVAFLILLILSMMTKSMIVRRRREFGIYRACGFTSRQLMIQIAAGFLPVSALGVTAGCILAGLTAAPMLTLLLSSIGSSRLDLEIRPLLLLGLGAGLLLFVFAVSFVSARRVKRITAYELLTE